jgi:hypothetical protein
VEFDYSPIGMYQEWIKLSSPAASENFSTIFGIHLLGHDMGRDAVHLIQPDVVRHNSNILLIGESTLTKKSTIQRLAKKIYPEDRIIYEEETPEALIEDLSSSGAQKIAFLGEFSSLLRSIAKGGYMAKNVEYYNDLFGSPDYYRRKLRHEEFVVKDAYLNINATITEEMLEKYLDAEMVEGGFMARFLMVKGISHFIPRGRLSRQALSLTKQIDTTFDAINRIEDKRIYFELTDEALKRYNEIEEFCLGNPEKQVLGEYSGIGPFAGRGLDYLVSFSDILLYNDMIGLLVENGEDLYSISTNSKIAQLAHKMAKEITPESANYAKYINLINCANCANPDGNVYVSKFYLEQAWSLIKACLDYTNTLKPYMMMCEEAKRMAKYLRKVKIATHSDVMKFAHIDANYMANARDTLSGRGEILVTTKEVPRFQIKNGVKIPRGSVTQYVYEWIGDENVI